MNIETVNKEKMEALESLAKTNLQVSEAKATLAEIKLDEDKYIAKREEKTLSRIDSILEESQSVLSEAYDNYNNIHNLSQSSAEAVMFLTEAHESFKELQNTFDKKEKEWEESIKKQEKHLSEIKKSILVDKTQIKNDQESILVRQVEIRDGFRLLADRRELLEKGFKELKELNKKI